MTTDVLKRSFHEEESHFSTFSTMASITTLSNSSFATTISNIAWSVSGRSYGPTNVSQSPRESTTMDINNSSRQNGEFVDHQLSVAYTASEGVVSLLAIFGNSLVAYVFCTNRSLRRYRNYYIFALAIADFLVGLFGIPFAVLSSIGLPRNLYGCLFTVSILMVLCTVSILCLVAVSIDRYWATTNPFSYYRHMTTSTAVGIILSCWVVGAVIGFLPLFGWYDAKGWNKTGDCFFRDVIDDSYLVFLYFATIIFPAGIMAIFYGYIYHIVLIKIRQKGNLVPQLRRPSEQSRSGSLNSDNRGGASQILRIIVSEKRREAKAAHKLGIIMLFFMICWMPLYTLNCIQAFCPDCKFRNEVWNFCVILSHANSSLNPLLYAYHLKEFRGAMKNALLLLLEKMLCGLMGGRLQKDGVPGPLSRSQTVPSLANPSTIGNTGKLSMKFRRSPFNNDQHRSIQITGKQSLAISTPSADNLQTTITDKSLTSISLASENSSFVMQESNSQILSIEADPNKPRFLEMIKCSSLVERDVQPNISHGIEIHVINIDADKEACVGEFTGQQNRGPLGNEIQQVTEVDGVIQKTDNELDSSRAIDPQMTTPL